MTLAKLARYFGYLASSTLFFFGVLIIAGYLFPSYIPSKFRVLIGIVFVLYGIYRFVLLHAKRP